MTSRTLNGSTTRSRLALVPATLLLTLVTACGGVSASTTSTSAGGGDSSAAVARASAAIDAAAAGDAEFPMPTAAFAPGTGKAAIIQCSAAAPVCVDAAKKAQAALEKAGWTTTPPGDAKYSPAEAGNLLDKAVLDGADVVIVVALNVNAFKSSVDKALAAGVQIGCAMCTSVGYEDKVWDAAVDFEKQGELMAQSLIAKNKGTGDIVLFEDKAYVQTTLRVQGAEKALKADCPNCKVEVRQFSAADLGKPGPPAFSALLSAKPSGTLTDVVAPYDAAGVLFAKTAGQQGRDDVALSGYDAAPEAIAALTTGTPVYEVTIGQPYEFSGVAAVDLALRAHAGAPTWDAATTLPSVLINKKNAATYDGRYFEPSKAYLDDFAALWTK